MAYEHTEVAVPKSQDGIRKMIMAHKGFGVAFISEKDPEGKLPSREGFHAKVMIKEKPYEVRITANLKAANANRYDSDSRKAAFVEQEERRVWRVLYHHLKSVFEAADTGVMEFRELMLPYIVMPSGGTIAEYILPQLDAKLAGEPSRLLSEGL